MSLLIYHHLPRTGGRSLAAVVRDNYASDEVVDLFHELLKARLECAAAGRELDPNDWYRSWYESLSEVDRERIKCVAGHNANRLMPVLTQPFQAFCLLRHPVERACSLYRFVSANDRPSAPFQRDGHRFSASRAIHRYGWSLADIYRELGGDAPSSSQLRQQFSRFFNGQTRRILEPWHDQAELEHGAGFSEQGAALRDEALDILRQHYVVGLQERFSESVELFAAKFGWSRVSVPHLNVSHVETGEGPDAETRALILEHSQLDAELHATFAAEMADHERVNSASRNG